MNNKDIQNQIIESLQLHKKVKIYFKLPTREPLYGRFVKMDDHEELWQKGYIRFVSEVWIDWFKKEQKKEYTRLHKVDGLSLVKPVEYVTD